MPSRLEGHLRFDFSVYQATILTMDSKECSEAASQSAEKNMDVMGVEQVRVMKKARSV